MTRTGAYILATLVLAGALLTAWLASNDRPDFEQPATLITHAGLNHPADIIRFNGRYVATELYGNRLAIFDDLALRNLEYFDPVDIGERFDSPHFLAVTPRGTLLVSNGWGNSIVEINDLNGDGWKAFPGRDGGLRAPHGICVDPEGWIYVGDSLNSRLVRFRDMDGNGWEVFRDVDKRVSYIRELVCSHGAVWASNSYENRPGLNPGHGSNVLKITDFESGRAEVMVSVDDANMTGVLPLASERVLVGLWGARHSLALFNPPNRELTGFPRLAPGVPYGTYHDRERKQVLVAYPGDVSDGERNNTGGLAVYR